MFETKGKTAMKTIDYIKIKLNAETIKIATTKENVVMENCLIDKKYEVVFVYENSDENDEKNDYKNNKVVVIC